MNQMSIILKNFKELVFIDNNIIRARKSQIYLLFFNKMDLFEQLIENNVSISQWNDFAHIWNGPEYDANVPLNTYITDEINGIKLSGDLKECILSAQQFICNQFLNAFDEMNRRNQMQIDKYHQKQESLLEHATFYVTLNRSIDYFFGCAVDETNVRQFLYTTLKNNLISLRVLGFYIT